MHKLVVTIGIWEASQRQWGWAWEAWSPGHPLESGYARTRTLAWAAAMAVADTLERENASETQSEDVPVPHWG